jgi:hypothetical protein
MPFVSDQPIVLIGPGSEWFWTAISWLVLAVTLVAIYRQIRVARSQNAVQQIQSYSEKWDSERLLRHRLAVVSAISRGDDIKANAYGNARAVGGFWEDMGALARAGHIDMNLLFDSSGHDAADYWLLLKAFAQELRAETGINEFYVNWEWLAARMDEVAKAHGIPDPDDAYVAKMLAMRSADYRAAIEVEEALRR